MTHPFPLDFESKVEEDDVSLTKLVIGNIPGKPLIGYNPAPGADYACCIGGRNLSMPENPQSVSKILGPSNPPPYGLGYHPCPQYDRIEDSF